MQKIALPAQWFARAVSNFDEVPEHIQNRAIPAEVPGCIHLDLLRENLIEDPYLAQNEWQTQWIGRTDWEFECQFFVSPEAMQEERIDLVCEGLDTVATVWVNGVQVGRSENMHVGARFDIKAALKNDENELKIRFDSAVYYARAQREKIGDLPEASSYRGENGAMPEPFHFIRKNACNFGWDWGPALITCGIWKTISVEAWSVARIASVRPIVRVANEQVAVVDLEIEVERTDLSLAPMPLFVLALLAKEDLVATATDSFTDNRICLTLLVRDPQLWNPIGYGSPTLYDLIVEIDPGEEREGEAFPLNEWSASIGLRETKLDTSPDEIGAKWDICINGQKIWCKGANWIPDDVFLPRANDPKRVRERLTQARDCGMNMIRVWGGGIYETDEFYSICDELGLLVWQDFLFACATYSEDEEMARQIEAEARFNISRLQHHASLVIWNGCNENLWGFFDWGWPEKLKGRGWGTKYYFEILPRLVKELAPETPYWPGSPFSGLMDIHPLADQYGNKHMWDTWNDVSHEHFRRYSPRFASEFGHQGPATFSTMARAIPETEREPYGETMLVHQKAAEGNAKLHARLHEIFEPLAPFDFDHWLYLTQLVQARAMQTAVEWFRTRSACSGALFWQLNDCWPVVSWAAIDGDGREKPLYFAAKHFFKERLLTIQPDGEGLALWAHNDSNETWIDTCDVWNASTTGQFNQSTRFSIHAAPRELKKVGVLTRSQEKNHLIYAKSHDSNAFWFFDRDKNLQYPEPKWQAEVNGNVLTIHAETLLRDLYINVDRFGGSVSENLVTLLPGESWNIEIGGISSDELAKVDFSSHPIVYCANWFGQK